MPQRLVAVVGGGALAPCRRHVLPQAAGGCQVLAAPLVVPAVPAPRCPGRGRLPTEVPRDRSCWTSSSG